MTSRRMTLAKIHIAKKDLGLSDDDYRFTLETVTGTDSCGDMSDRQLSKVLDHFKEKGWTPKYRGSAPRKRGNSSSPQGGSSPIGKRRRFKPKSKHADVRLIYALWWDLHASGKLDCTKDQRRAALAKFVKRACGIDNPEWLEGKNAQDIIEACKAMKKRKGK